MRVLLVQEEEDSEVEGGDLPVTEQVEVVAEKVELSLNSVVGLVTPGTMKLKGRVEELQVTVLIDCGATHNFIALGLVQKLELPITMTTSYGVILGSGKSIWGKGICKGVTLEMQGLTVVEGFLPIILGGTKIILRMQWLSSLGSMEVNWKLLVMKFKLGDTIITLRGDQGIHDARISLKVMLKTVQQ